MKRPKAAVLTFCNNNGPTNYGQILQCYAVQTILENSGYDVVVVLYQKLTFREISSLRNKRFRRFIAEHIHTSELCYSISDVEEVTKDCEALVCGSDQVWHPDTIDAVWALGFGSDRQKRISIAVSGLFFDDEKTDRKLRELRDELERFDVITVRENYAKTLLSRYIDKKIETILDPTLFLSAEEWDGVAAEPEGAEEYILCYCLGSVRPYGLIFREASRLYGNIKIKYIPTNLFGEGRYGFMEPVWQAGPAEFLTLVKNARAVFTDSYHGIIFSIIYGVDWYLLNRKAEGADRLGGKIRIENLLEKLRLPVRWISNTEDVRKRYGECGRRMDMQEIHQIVSADKEKLNVLAKVL